jgi:hypothetical protein
MLINSLDTMESIVENNDSLSWDGWTVVESTPSSTAWSKPGAAFVNGVWNLVRRYEPTEKGWNISSKLVGKNVA